jgi:hypothetical protein
MIGWIPYRDPGASRVLCLAIRIRSRIRDVAWRAAAILWVGALAAFVSAASSSASTPLKQITVSPAVGGPGTIFHVHYDADIVEGGGASDDLYLNGPKGTACAGMLVDGATAGRASGFGGPVTLYIGPGASVAYPTIGLGGSGTYEPATDDPKPLRQWCPGTYTGQIWFEGPTPAILEGTFTLVVSASKHGTPPPRATVARHLRQVTVSPRPGAAKSIFDVRYLADQSGLTSGDVVELDGPRRSACSGSLLRVVTTRRNDPSGLGQLTLHIGPGAVRKYPRLAYTSAYDPLSPKGTQAPLRRWCAGTYNGRIWLEKYANFVLEAHFQLTVAKPTASTEPRRAIHPASSPTRPLPL